MSKYRRIETEFRDENTLRQALADVCQARRIEFETGEGLALHGFEGDRRRETAELVIRRLSSAGLKCAMPMHQECTRSDHPNCTGLVNQE